MSHRLRDGVRPFLAVLAAGALAVSASACGGDDAGAAADAGPLVWVTPPEVFKTRALPNDRVALGTVRNSTSAPVDLDASALQVLDADGRKLTSTGAYAAGYAHGLYGAFQKPDPLPPEQLKRLGLVVTIPPGKTAPLAVSWTFPTGSDATKPATVEYGKGQLALPTTVKPGAGGL